jgi:hypothetical protein
MIKRKFNDAGLMIIKYNFHKHFDLRDLLMKLIDLNKIETAKILIGNDL